MRILVADDHDVARVGLKHLLVSHPSWEVCAEATNGHDAVCLAQQFQPQLVVIDISMPGLNGLEATRKIRQLLPQAKVVILTMHFSHQLVEAGARGYIIKSDAETELVSAVEAVANGGSYFTSAATDNLLRPHTMPDAAVANRKKLTPRQREVAGLLAGGKSTKEVAGALKISTKTAETHRANIMRKLELHNITGLVRYAIKSHLIAGEATSEF
jgi:DNA-binding NarL/FixJ family response regulator